MPVMVSTTAENSACLAGIFSIETRKTPVAAAINIKPIAASSIGNGSPQSMAKTRAPAPIKITTWPIRLNNVAIDLPPMMVRIGVGVVNSRANVCRVLLQSNCLLRCAARVEGKEDHHATQNPGQQIGQWVLFNLIVGRGKCDQYLWRCLCIGQNAIPTSCAIWAVLATSCASNCSTSPWCR